MNTIDRSYCEAFLADLPPIDWSDLEAAAPVAESACRRIGTDKRLLRELVARTAGSPKLFGMCECHDLDDKIVLHDDLPRGYRIRLRLANDEQYERAHNHRFPFAAYILHGTYFQQWYHIRGTPSERTRPADVTTLARRVEGAGASFTISADAFHSTQTTPKTVSLMICGPAVRDRSFIINMDSGKVWEKIGRKHETPQQIAKSAMTREVLDKWIGFMESVELL